MSLSFFRPVALCALALFVVAGAADAQQQQRQQQRRAATPAQPATPPTRIPPPGPAEVPLFPARDYTDPRSNLQLTVPAGWLVIEVPQVPEGELARLFMEGPGTPAPNCSVVVQRPQQPARVTQASLNQAIHRDQSVAAIRTQLAQQGRRVVNIRKVTQGGLAGIVAQVALPGGPHLPEMTTFVVLFEQVGRRFSINCTTMSLDLDTMRPDIEGIVRSLRFPSA
jgi:hypothetical protein